MAAKTTDWRPGPTVCRCCLSEGCYKDISTEYFWMGKREVYSEMLLSAFNLTISYSQSGGPNSNSRLICEPCISRLRDASDFKRQVQECEKTFMQYIDPGMSSIGDAEVPEEQLETQVKVEQVKEEKMASDDDFDDRGGFDDDDDDDLDDQPLTKLASKVPKKESVDLLDLLDNAKAAVKRKSTTKTKVVPAKKSKTTKKEVKPTSSSKTLKIEKMKKEIHPMAVARRNAKFLVKFTTAYPFKLPDCALVCVYCREEHEVPASFREHVRQSHPDVKTRVAFAHIPEGYIKVDCTDLTCRICSESHTSIESIAKHLAEVHNKYIDFNNDLGVQPFTFHTDVWTCALCNKKHSTLRALSRHTQSHFQKYTCEQCGKSYFSSSSLRHHLIYCQIGDLRVCAKCKKTFKTLEARREHLKESPRCWPFVCKNCGERFVTATLKNEHRAQAHGEQSRTYVCPECREVFPDRIKYRSHFVMTHTDQYFTCTCGQKFATKGHLEEHKVVHTKEKLFPCTSCPKSFSRKKNLIQHMWIHSEVKRFECVQCNKKFNQRVTYKTHMRSYHPDVVIS